MRTKYLDKGMYLVKFLSDFIEVRYHTINFLSYYNMPIHYICNEVNCPICRVNSLIEEKFEFLQLKFEEIFKKRLFPKKKIEYAILISDITNRNGQFIYDNLYWLMLKPWQCLPILDKVIEDNYPKFNDPFDPYVMRIVYDTKLYVSSTHEIWFLIDPVLQNKIFEQIQKISDIYTTLNIQTDIDTASHIYVSVVRKLLVHGTL